MNKPIVLYLTIIFGSCEDEPQALKFDPSHFPLQVGNYWEYVPASSSQGRGLVSVQVEIPSTATIGNHEYYLMVSKWIYADNTIPHDSSYFRVDSKGYVFERGTRDLEEANRFRLAAAEGHAWTIQGPRLKDYVVNTGVTGPSILNGITIENCRRFYFNLPAPAIDDEHAVTLAPGLGIISNFTLEGLSSILKKATIAGTEYNF